MKDAMKRVIKRVIKRAMKRAIKRVALLGCLAALLPAPASADERAPLRDPMRPPLVVSPRVGGAVAAESPAPIVRQLLLRDGQRYVVDGGRRRAVGDMLGDARIEAIEDSAVLVRRAGRLQRLPLFAGVSKQPTPEPGPAASAQPGPAPARTALAPTRPTEHLQRAGNPP